MTEVRATLRFARIAPQKARRVARAIQGLPVPVADARLPLLAPRAAPMFLKLLRSAVANAKDRGRGEQKDLKVLAVRVNEGPRLKRWMPRARGRADLVMKRTSHLEVVLGDGRAPAAERQGEKAAQAQPAAIETARVEELSDEQLRAAEGPAPAPSRAVQGKGAVKPVEAPRGIRRLITRKHGV